MPSDSNTVERAYQEALRLQRAGKLEEASARYVEVLRLAPDHAEALHCLGNIDARQGRFANAERLLRKAVALEPLRANFANSLGNLLKSRGLLDEAGATYRQAIALQPDFANTHNNLGELRLRQGRLEEAADACFKALEINPNFASAYNNLGRALNNMGQLDEAKAAFRRAAVIRPDFAEAYNHLGHVLRAQNELSEALEVFEHATQLRPELADSHRNLGVTLLAAGETERGIQSLEHARDLRPQHVPTLLDLGVAYHIAGRPKFAAQSYRRVIAIDPAHADAHLNLGLILHEQRRHDEAEAAFLAAATQAPERAEIYAELASIYEETNRLEDLAQTVDTGLALAPEEPRLNLQAAKADRRAGRPQDGLARLLKFDPDKLTGEVAEQFHYELGRAHDRLGNPDPAYGHFVAANRLAALRPDAQLVRPKRFLRLLDNLRAFYESADPATWPLSPPAERPAPVFMIGFPRSGTTLLEVVLDGHPSIITLEERNTLVPVLAELQRVPGGYPKTLARLDGGEIQRLRGVYFERLDELVGDAGDKLVIDKMPLNTAHAGAIRRLFPDARFIFSLRHPCDVVLSNFMQNFAMNDAMANFCTLADAATVYDKIMSLWQLYNQRFTVLSHTVRYEALIADLEGVSRELLEFLDLDWDPGLLEYAERARGARRVNTTSYHQVTEGIYTRASGRWRAYSGHFGSIKHLLSDHVDKFGYEY
jgi:tetratricopeptide (TPR) repeat protein